MRIQWTRRRTIAVAVLAIGILVAWPIVLFWWASRRAHDERFVGQWAQAVPAATMVLESSGVGSLTDQATGAKTPIRWWTEEGSLYIEYDLGGVATAFRRRVAQIAMHYDYRKWSVVAIEPDRMRIGPPASGGSMEWNRIKSDAPNEDALNDQAPNDTSAMRR